VGKIIAKKRKKNKEMMKETFTIGMGEQLNVVIEGWNRESIKQYLSETYCMTAGDFLSDKTIPKRCRLHSCQCTFYRILYFQK